MNILITGSNGFIGKNLKYHLKSVMPENNILEYDVNDKEDSLDEYLKKANIIFHLAGVNRTSDVSEFKSGNTDLTKTIIKKLEDYKNIIPIVVTSSIQAELDNAYGVSKKEAEKALFKYSEKNHAPIYVYRLTNVFGKWSKPNYNSVVATFCYNISRDIPISINNANTNLKLIYIDDILKEFVDIINSDHIYKENKYFSINPEYDITLGELAEKIYSFSKYKDNLFIPNTNNELEKKLFSTYLSYAPKESFKYPLTKHEDNRGAFLEIIKSKYSGQISLNISKPGVTKGNHWHHTKVEKFILIKGIVKIRFKHLVTNEIFEYELTDEAYEVVDIPPGYSHQILNVGKKDAYVLIWANEIYDKDNADTFYNEF